MNFFEKFHCLQKDYIKASLWQKVVSMFNVVGLPGYVNETIFKIWLFMSGSLFVFNDNGKIKYGIGGYGGGKILEDGLNSRVIISTATSTYEREVYDTGIIWLNSLMCPIEPLVDRYSKFIEEGDTSLLVELFNVRSCKTPIARTDSEKRQLEELFKAQERGIRFVPKVPSIELKDTQIADLADGTKTHNLSELMDYRQRIVAEFDNQLGIGVFDGMKRERMVTDELNNILASSRLNVQDMFRSIENGLEDCNKKLGLSLSLEYSECYKVETLENVSRETLKEEGGEQDDNMGNSEG